MAIIRNMSRRRAALVFIACYAGTVGLARAMAAELSLVGLVIVALAALIALAAGVRGLGPASAERRAVGQGPRSRALVLALVTLASLGFWSGSAAAMVLLESVSGSGVEAEVVIAAAGLALLGAGLGGWMARRGLEVSPVTRMAVGLIGLALACVCVAGRVELEAPQLVGAGIVALALALACVGPASVAAIARFARPAARGPWLAASMASLVLGRGFGVLLADHALSAAQVFECCLGLGFAAIAVAVLSSPTWRPLRELDRQPGWAA